MTDTLQDIFDIQQLLNRYSVAVGQRDWQSTLATFAPDGVWAVPALAAEFQGHEQLGPAMASFANKFDYFLQLNAPAVIEVRGDTATAISSIRETGKYQGRNEALDVVGFYYDQLIRTAEGWKFSRRTFDGRGSQKIALLP